MMLKVIIFAYTQRIYSCRQIAKALRENINFMWIAGNNKPDFRTINRFRSVLMKDIIDEIFKSVVELLIEDGYIDFENYFLDGTKIEASANKYGFVWAKAIKKYKVKLQDKISELLAEIDKILNGGSYVWLIIYPNSSEFRVVYGPFFIKTDYSMNICLKDII